LIQGFFQALLHKEWLTEVDQNKGRLRTFLLTAFRRFMAKEWRRATAEIRGGTMPAVPLEDHAAELRYATAKPDLSADHLFDRQWTLLLIERIFEGLRREFEQDGKGDEFENLKDTLMAGRGAIVYL
jgi:RNA polymerase sigma-70 factor (ECF subfamily)